MPSLSIHTPQQVRDAYRQVLEHVAAAAGRSGRKPQDIAVVAVTKTASPEQIRQLLELGQRDFGENRVQQLTQRVAQLQEFLARRRLLGRGAEGPVAGPPGSPAPGSSGSPTGSAEPAVRWHMIGHLQRNKIKQVAPLVRLVHSVDSLRLAEELHGFAAAGDRVIDVLLQVNISGQESKFGVAPPAAYHLAEQIDSLLHLRLRGLMAMAPYAENAEEARPYFARMRDLFEEIRGSRVAGGACNLLSMGMSGDYRVAIEEGANVVRIGRAFFGEGALAASPTQLPDRPPRRGNDDEERDAADAEESPSASAARQTVARENRNAREK